MGTIKSTMKETTGLEVMFDYPVELTSAEEGGFIVTFPDVPEAITQAEDLMEAQQRVREAA
jgi:antitoxin HicB